MSERKLRAREGALPASKVIVLPRSHVSSGRGEGVMARSFKGANGSIEHFFMIDAPKGGSFEDQTAGVQERYAEALKQRGLTPETAIFRRIFLSDILNQADALCDSALVEEIAENPVSTSIIQQLPLSGSKIALLAYHIESPDPFGRNSSGPGTCCSGRTACAICGARPLG